MANNDNIIYAKFNHGREITTDSRSQYAYGQVLKISGLHLSASFDADISNKGDKQAKVVIGTDNELPIDDVFFLSGKDVIVMINVHAADKDGRTKYIIRIPVEKRPERADIELEPVEQDAISVAIATLNEAVEQTSASAESAENNANRAHESAVNAEMSATSASNSEVLAQQYMERAETAAENAEQSETKAKTSEDNAKASETHAEQIATEIEQYTGRAETASTNAQSSASTATQKATEASTNANIATTKANEVSTSATNAQNSADNAQQSATDAQESANSASASASRALVNAEKTQSDKEIVELAKSNVLSAVGEAQTYATTAQSASQAIQDMNVEAVTLEVDSDVTVEKSVDPVTGAVTLTYGIPKGVKGDTGNKGDKGDPFVYSDFTPEQLASLKGAKGDKGDKGDTGDDYILTQQDKEDIAGLVDTPVDDVQIDGTSIIADGVANVPLASSSQVGVIRTQGTYGLNVNNAGLLYIYGANKAKIKSGTEQYQAIQPQHQHYATFYGLAKAAGHDEKDSTLAVGAYTDEAKTAIKTMLGVEDPVVDDVQVNGASIVTDGVANIPIVNASGTVPVGLVKPASATGTAVASNGGLAIVQSNLSAIKTGANQYNPIVPQHQHESVFYGLAKIAGHDEKDSTLAVGAYTDEAKSAIQSMLGVPSEDNVVSDVQINGTSIIADGVANISLGNNSQFGAVKGNTAYGINIANGEVRISSADSNLIKVGSTASKPLTPNTQHESTFYGLAKASGDTTQSQSSNAVGTYTDEAKASIQSMLGVPSEDEVVIDVQIDGTSIVDNNIVNIPFAAFEQPGIGRIGTDYGITMLSGTRFVISRATSALIKSGTQNYRPIVSSNQHEAVFYGLAKAAGSDEKDSTLPVGQYTDSAQTAIKQMLNIKDDYDSLVVEVSGTDPIITGKPSYRYNCGELYTLSITPPESGTMDIIFTSGATPTVLTLPNTVKMPIWWAGIETNTTYEMCITDGTYCGVMSWAT